MTRNAAANKRFGVMSADSNAILNFGTCGICSFSLTDIAKQQILTSTN